MKNILLASVAFVLVAATSSFASTPGGNPASPMVTSADIGLQMLADKGSSGNSGSGGGNSGSGGGNSGSGGGGDDGDDHDSGDDHGGASGDDDDNDDNSNDDNQSGRRKPRVPGGSGCDSAEDRAEHPECAG